VLLVFFLLVAVMPTIVKADALNDCLADSTKSVADCMKISQDALAGSSGYNTTDPAAGDRAVIGAGSVVVKDVPAGATVAGNPAKILKRK
jgi:serine acetyltransferase